MASNFSFRFLTATQIKRLHFKLIASASPTQPTLLESAVDSPMNHKSYGQTDVFQLAGILAEKVILNHAFQDGNKRTALFAADMFLKMNGYQIQKTPIAQTNEELDESLANAHVLVATGQWTSEDLGNRCANLAKPLQDVSNEVRSFAEDAVEH